MQQTWQTNCTVHNCTTQTEGTLKNIPLHNSDSRIQLLISNIFLYNAIKIISRTILKQQFKKINEWTSTCLALKTRNIIFGDQCMCEDMF